MSRFFVQALVTVLAAMALLSVSSAAPATVGRHELDVEHDGRIFATLIDSHKLDTLARPQIPEQEMEEGDDTPAVNVTERAPAGASNAVPEQKMEESDDTPAVDVSERSSALQTSTRIRCGSFFGYRTRPGYTWYRFRSTIITARYYQRFGNCRGRIIRWRNYIRVAYYCGAIIRYCRV